MTDIELDRLIQILMDSTALGRLTRDEVEKALRLAEARGYQITVPADV